MCSLLFHGHARDSNMLLTLGQELDLLRDYSCQVVKSGHSDFNLHSTKKNGATSPANIVTAPSIIKIQRHLFWDWLVDEQRAGGDEDVSLGSKAKNKHDHLPTAVHAITYTDQ